MIAYMLQEESTGNGLVFIFDEIEEFPFKGHEAEILLQRLRHEGLVNSLKTHGLITLSPKGRKIAYGAGGYKGFLEQMQAEQQAQQERAVRQEISTTRVGWINIGLTAGSFIATAIATCVAWQANANNTVSDHRLKVLESQVQKLRQHQALPRKDSATTILVDSRNKPAISATEQPQSR
ncbi:hypothetical protein H8B13_09045 [Hymenobacter sp. BT188]|uniref:hypothetical protein n=1 Tax=Hymenobacter sp. BT188 TaxID=2763504 RepID=UPI0016513BFB|nr:hypothetical protein [Hymenobacter sp. BT188]MBC6606962.1 hypothetical protein [Hymenobacter sp. BT188]